MNRVFKRISKTKTDSILFQSYESSNCVILLFLVASNQQNQPKTTNDIVAYVEDPQAGSIKDFMALDVLEVFDSLMAL